MRKDTDTRSGSIGFSFAAKSEDSSRPGTTRRTFWRHRDDTCLLYKVGFLLMSAGALLAAIGLLWGCGAPRRPESRPDTRMAPEHRQAPETRLTDSWAFQAWADAKARELSDRFGVPRVVSRLADEPAPTTGETAMVCSFGTCRLQPIAQIGEYDRRTKAITVWTQYPDGQPIPPEVIRHTYFHEWLHFLDHHQGKAPAKGDHIALFDRRIAELGLE